MKAKILTSAFFCIMWLLGLCAHGRNVSDTLFTTSGDRIILKYSVEQAGDSYTLKFLDKPRITLTKGNKKYEQEVVVLFFDRKGNYPQDRKVDSGKGVYPESFKYPSGYERSEDGVFVVDECPKLTFPVSGNTKLSIPIFLARHPNEKYTLISKCRENLNIKLSRQQSSPLVGGSTQTMEQEIITSTEELEADYKKVTDAIAICNTAKPLLEKAETLPFSPGLEDDISYLRQLKREITDDETLQRINEVLDLYDAKTVELRDAAEEAINSLKAEEEAKLQAEKDSIAAAAAKQAEEAKAEAEKEKKRNLWLMIGAAILAVLGFVGNQVLQTIRNRKNQRNLQNMQQGITKQAENEAKRLAQRARMDAERKARDAAQKAKNSVQTKAKGEIDKAVRKAKTITINGKSKNLSI